MMKNKVTADPKPQIKSAVQDWAGSAKKEKKIEQAITEWAGGAKGKTSKSKSTKVKPSTKPDKKTSFPTSITKPRNETPKIETSATLEQPKTNTPNSTTAKPEVPKDKEEKINKALSEWAGGSISAKAKSKSTKKKTPVKTSPAPPKHALPKSTSQTNIPPPSQMKSEESIPLRYEAFKSLIDHLEKLKGTGTKGIFRVGGNQQTVEKIYRSLAQNPPPVFSLQCINGEGIPEFADALKRYLRAAPEPLIPHTHLQKFIDAMKTSEPVLKLFGLMEAIKDLKEENRTRFDMMKDLCYFLNRVVLNKDSTLMDEKNIGIIFGPCVAGKGNEMKIGLFCEIVHLLVTNYGELFESSTEDWMNEKLGNNPNPEAMNSYGRRTRRRQNPSPNPPLQTREQGSVAAFSPSGLRETVSDSDVGPSPQEYDRKQNHLKLLEEVKSRMKAKEEVSSPKAKPPSPPQRSDLLTSQTPRLYERSPRVKETSADYIESTTKGEDDQKSDELPSVGSAENHENVEVDNLETESPESAVVRDENEDSIYEDTHSWIPSKHSVHEDDLSVGGANEQSDIDFGNSERQVVDEASTHSPTDEELDNEEDNDDDEDDDDFGESSIPPDSSISRNFLGKEQFPPPRPIPSPRKYPQAPFKRNFLQAHHHNKEVSLEQNFEFAMHI